MSLAPPRNQFRVAGYGHFSFKSLARELLNVLRRPLSRAAAGSFFPPPLKLTPPILFEPERKQLRFTRTPLLRISGCGCNRATIYRRFPMFSARQSISSYHRIVKSLSTAALAAVFATLLAVTALLPSAAAQSYDFCTGGTLDGGNQTSPQDLVITNMTCTVDGSKTSYYFGKVYIFGGGTLTFNNVTMDFYAKSILVQNGGVLQSNGTIGAGGQTLTIHLYGSSTDQGITCKKMDNGNVVDDQYCGVPTTVWGSNTYTHYPNTPCTKTPDLPGKVNDCFYPYGTFDQGDVAGAYFGRKVLALSYGGAINLSGFRGAQGGMDNMPAVTGSSWMRLNATLNGGEDALTVSGMPADWQPSDPQHPIYIVVTSTDYLPGHAEQLQVGSVSGSTVTLTGGTVQNPHWGKVYSLNNANVPCNAPSGTTDCLIGPELLFPGQDNRYVDTRAAVGLLSRSIRIISDGATAGSTFTGYYGGHTVVRQGFMSYQIQGVEFYQLGQGGAIMHYPVHFHLARLTPAGTYVKDSSVWDSMTRWIVIHATQGVTLARNVGYKSIGHGYYLEDGTETDNVLNTNLGVFARAAVDNEQNPRKVPGILAEPGHPGDVNPYHSDWEFPTLFWIMNGWNDFQYNFASSAGTCGVCYWLLPGGISGPSQYEWFDGYAGQQVVNPYALNNEGKPAPISQAGYSPLKTFVGNSCTTAMTSFLNIGQTDPCLGVSNTGARGELPAVSGVAPNKAPVQGDDPYYPYVTALRTPTGCTGTSCRCDSLTPGCNAPCSGQNGSEGNCVVTTLDRYTTSFNWASKNFAAIWLRPWWFLLQNSAITDVQQGGLTFVTSGGYTRSEVAQGYWSLLRKSVLVGNTQSPTGEPANPYASSAGPFNPKGLQCQEIGPLTYCLSSKEGISYPYEFYSVNQKLFSIYDGPAYQERNAYLDIPVTKVGTPADCTSDGVQQLCKKSKYLYGTEFGVKLDPIRKECYLPNAGIAWKQSNGFFYPPAFHSDNLFFNNVAIRHFVIEPLFLPGTFTTDPVAVTKIYCTWKTDMFRNFTDVDRQTVLNDDDGSLTGLVSELFESDGTTPVESISVNEDSFFNAPTVTVECSSDFHAAGKPATGCPGTANTSPYEY